MGLQALARDMGSQVRPPARLAWVGGESQTYWCSSPHLPNSLCLLGSSFLRGDFLHMTVWDTQLRLGAPQGENVGCELLTPALAGALLVLSSTERGGGSPGCRAAAGCTWAQPRAPAPPLLRTSSVLLCRGRQRPLAGPEQSSAPGLDSCPISGSRR